MTKIKTTSNRRRKRSSKPTKWSSIKDMLLTMGYSSLPYRFLISRRVPIEISGSPGDLRSGDATLGNKILAGNFSFVGQTLNVQIEDSVSGLPWNNYSFGENWLAALHGFTWLRDLRAVGSEVARQKARETILEWILTHKSIDSLTWRPDIIGQRLHSWLVNGEFILFDADQNFKQRFFRSIALQSQHLSRTVRKGPEGASRFTAIKGLFASGICIPEAKRWVEIAERALLLEIDIQILPDGGHLERSPSSHIVVLSDLLDISSSLSNANLEVPERLRTTIDCMAPMLRTYRHGDGAFALFNDSHEESAWLIDVVLAQTNSRARAHMDAPQTGFRRLQAGRTLIIVDSGKPASIGNRVHAGTMSFELSIGKERLLVNCGTWLGGDETWRAALRATAAHTTLAVDDTNSSELLPGGGVGIGPTQVTVERIEKDGAILLTLGHDGFLEPFGLMHDRRIYLSDDGYDIRGEDVLRPKEGIAAGRSFAIRFHLHPTVQASLVQAGSSILLRMPSGTGWQMRTKGCNMDLAESIYSGQPGERRRSNQIVLTGPIHPKENFINWSLKRIPKN